MSFFDFLGSIFEPLVFEIHQASKRFLLRLFDFGILLLQTKILLDFRRRADLAFQEIFVQLSLADQRAVHVGVSLAFHLGFHEKLIAGYQSLSFLLHQVIAQ